MNIRNFEGKIIVSVILMLLAIICIAPLTAFADYLDLSTANIDIEGVKFNYNVGDNPEAKAYKCDPWDELYDIVFLLRQKTKINLEKILQ